MINANTLGALGGLLGLTVLLMVAYWAIVRARTAARGLNVDRPFDRLAALKAAYEAGQMDTGEFERVRKLIHAEAEGGRLDPPPSRVPDAKQVPQDAKTPHAADHGEMT